MIKLLFSILLFSSFIVSRQTINNDELIEEIKPVEQTQKFSNSSKKTQNNNVKDNIQEQVLIEEQQDSYIQEMENLMENNDWNGVIIKDSDDENSDMKEIIFKDEFEMIEE